jgi:hypothetical protein
VVEEVLHQTSRLNILQAQSKWFLLNRRARLTSIQGKGNNANGSIIFRTGGATGTIVATYLFGEEGLDMYLPGLVFYF